MGAPLPVLPEIEETEWFLDRLVGDAPATFQTLNDKKTRDKRLVRILHGRFAQHESQLIELSMKGAGVFVMVNAGDLKGRTTNNVTRVRAIFVDLDGAPLEPVEQAPLKPHIVVESSPGRFHAYWIVDGIALNEFRQIQISMARRFGGDLKVCDLPRLMRLPGFIHQKGVPFLTNLRELRPYRNYERTEFFQAFGLDPKIGARGGWREGGLIPEGQRNDNLFRRAVAFHQNGLPKPQVEKRIARINRTLCVPPLDDEEVKRLVDSACRQKPNYETRLPNALLDDPTFAGMVPAAQALLIRVIRLQNGDRQKSVSLNQNDMRHFGFRCHKTLAGHRDRLIKVGLLRVVRQARGRKAGETRECALYLPVLDASQ